MKVFETGFQKWTWSMHKCVVSKKNKISNTENNYIKKQKYAKSKILNSNIAQAILQ